MILVFYAIDANDVLVFFNFVFHLLSSIRTIIWSVARDLTAITLHKRDFKESRCAEDSSNSFDAIGTQLNSLAVKMLNSFLFVRWRRLII